MSEFLLELFSEEIPAGLQRRGADELQKLILAKLKEAGLKYGDSRTLSGPRRLALVIEEVAAKSPDISIERKGPRVGAKEKALAGFLRGAGLESIEQCEVVEDKKGAFYVAKIEKPGLAAEEILANAIKEAVENFPWPKSMRWGTGKLRWVRPLHSILALLGGRVVELEVGGIKSGDKTFGHRFMAPDAIAVQDADDYESKLIDAFVVSDSDEREIGISETADILASDEELELVKDQGLLAETAGLVEWPTVLMGDFDEAFLDVPPEVLITSMKKHQKCFSLRDPKTGKLANKFLLVSNLIANDKGKAIINGNERVIRARLSDANFFWDQDRKVRLEDMAEKLDDIIFHEKLGSQGKRVERIAALARELAPIVGADPKEAERAAKLCKADLVSEMVGEFANLQGLMGRYYAKEQGESDAVAAACEKHYRPQGPSDAIPTEPVSIAVALADKLNMLVGFWTIGEKPTGSSDPFALRRAALGAIRIVLENDLKLPFGNIVIRKIGDMRARLSRSSLDARHNTLQEILEAFGVEKNVIDEMQYLAFEDHFSPTSDESYKKFWRENHEVTIDLLAFFADRLKVYLRDKGARHDLIDAVFSLGGQDDLLMIVRRVEALGAFLDSDDGANLLIGIKRAENILRIEEKKDKRSFDQSVDEILLKAEQEIDLFKAILAMEEDSAKALERDDFETAMTHLAALRTPVDAFFDHVTVNTDEEKGKRRKNRLNLLARIRTATDKIADFSKIEG